MPKRSIVKRPNPQPSQGQSFTCGTCGKEKNEQQFYKLFNEDVHIQKFLVCKKCIKDACFKDGNVNLDAFKTILTRMDRPFLRSVYLIAIENKSDPIGDYFRTLNLPTYSQKKWADSIGVDDPIYNSDDEDMVYSRDWMGTYTNRDIECLEDYLKSLKADFKITTRNHLDYARKIAKASLAMDRAYEELVTGKGSEKKYQTLKEVFDTLSKSASFAESGRGINDVSLGCFGTTFDRVEKNTWVPQHVPFDKDIYDLLLDQFANINKSL